jgi:hypothetical protein
MGAGTKGFLFVTPIFRDYSPIVLEIGTGVQKKGVGSWIESGWVEQK